MTNLRAAYKPVIWVAQAGGVVGRGNLLDHLLHHEAVVVADVGRVDLLVILAGQDRQFNRLVAWRLEVLVLQPHLCEQTMPGKEEL